MARITTIPLFRKQSLSAGDACTSDPIDLRDIAQTGSFSIASKVEAGTATTAGTTIFTYTGANERDDTYASPASNAIGTSGVTIGSYLHGFSPVLSPFVKVVATQTGAGTLGANSKITAELNVR